MGTPAYSVSASRSGNEAGSTSPQDRGPTAQALALGANAVLIGRSTLYGAAAAGEAGATRAITIVREEIDRVLALLGCTDVAALNADYLEPNNLRPAPSPSS